MSVTFLAVCDSESYVKWAARLVDQITAANPGIHAQVLIVDSPIRPTDTQIAAALAGSTLCSVNVLSIDQLRTYLQTAQVDVLLAAATGPVVAQVFALASALPRRPGLLSGLPGMGLPATRKGMIFRLLMDGFITHSPREAGEYRTAAEAAGICPAIVTTRLSMLRSPGLPPRPAPDAAVDTLVFAAQAKVPPTAAQREQILLSLARFSRMQPGRKAMVKLRSRPGEVETHHEHHSYASLLAQLKDRGEVKPGEIDIAYGPMAEYLRPGTGLVSVSSTAALEAVDAGCPTLLIGDFGINPELLNEVFADSGMIGTLADVAAGQIGFPHERWLTQNYFQPPNAELNKLICTLAQRSRNHQLADHSAHRRRQRRILAKAWLRTKTPRALVTVYRRIRFGS